MVAAKYIAHSMRISVLGFRRVDPNVVSWQRAVNWPSWSLVSYNWSGRPNRLPDGSGICSRVRRNIKCPTRPSIVASIFKRAAP